MWAISNITAVPLQIQKVIDAEIFPKLFIMLSPARNEHVDVKKQIYYVITNALTGAYNPQIQYLIDQRVIQQLCGGSDMDAKILTILLDGLEAILKYGYRSDKLEDIFKIIEERIEALQSISFQIIWNIVK